MLGEFSAGDKFSLYKGAKRYELTNHLGNVLSVVSDELTPNGEAQVLSAKDYYPFGMSMPSRTTEGGTYRYGFNGQERDTELGESVYTAEFWQYSANLGRRWNVDPITFPNISPYATFNDNPIVFTDLSGASPEQGTPVKDTEPSYKPAQGEHLLQEVVITAARMNQAPTSAGSRPSTFTKMTINFVATADAYLSNLLLKPSTFLKPEEYGGGELARIARQGHMVGHSIAIGQGIAEIWGGEGMIGGGGVVTATGVGAAPGIATMAAGAGTIAHGTTMIAVATHKIVLLQMEENANDLHNTSRESLPEYENPGHHDPKATNFNKEKSVLPENHIELFEKSVLGPDGNRWTKVGAGKKSVYHRFQDDGNGKWHWNGSSNAMLKNNKPNPIKEQNIPIEIKRLK